MFPEVGKTIEKINKEVDHTSSADVNATIKQQIALVNDELVAADTLTVGQTKEIIASLCRALRNTYPSRQFVYATVASIKKELTEISQEPFGSRTIIVQRNNSGKYYFSIR